MQLIHRCVQLLLLVVVLMPMEVSAAKPRCDDGVCTGSETAATCPEDCDVVSQVCGNGVCDSSESCSTCAEDCGECPVTTCNNDTICNFGEDCLSCPDDCNGVTGGKKSGRYCCGGATEEELYCDESRCGEYCGEPSAICGNEILEPPEGCDDGNTVNLDGCSSACQVETPVCGNRVLEPPEECDDGNTLNLDGCSSACQVEIPVCGNGVLEPPEECDDGNTLNLDGCSSACQVETPVCGNNVIEEGEQCDDGNTTPGDGCNGDCLIETTSIHVPENQFNVGDSIGEAEAADGTIGRVNHEAVWSTGYDETDIVNALNERFKSTDDAAYQENTGALDYIFNHAVSGDVMADFSVQAQQITNAAASTESGRAGQISLLLGNNDVCADDMASMTDISQFEAQFRAGLDVLAGSELTREAVIHVSSLPAIYWLWESRAGTSPLSWCRLFAWPNVPCQNLLAGSGDDCASVSSREDPDMIHDGDGSNCERRKQFHARIRDEYNIVLRDVIDEYTNRSQLPMPNLEYIDIFDVRFDREHVNGGDCFHPSMEGHKLLSIEQYCRSRWSEGDSACVQ